MARTPDAPARACAGERPADAGTGTLRAHAVGARAMTLRYLAAMLLLSPIHLAIITTFLAIAHRLDALPKAIALNVVLLVAVNAAGSLAILFAPIGGYLRGQRSFATAAARIHALPWLSAGWSVLLTVAISSIGLFGLGMMCPGCDPVVMLPYRLSMMFVFVAYCGSLMYFVVGDYAASLKKFLLDNDQVIVPTSGGRFIHKLLMAFVVTTALPVSLAFLEAFVFPAARLQQGLAPEAGFRFDLVLSVLMAGLAFLFVLRAMLRPVRALTATVEEVEGGRLDARAPIISDDEMGELACAFNRLVGGLEEREFLRNTFTKYVPDKVAQDILANRGAIKPELRTATILYTDIQGFTALGEALQPEELLSALDEYFALLVDIIERHRGIVLQFQGDAILSAFNVPVSDAEHAAHAVQAAVGIQRELAKRRFLGRLEMVTRIGVNTGQVIAGAVGPERRLGYTVHGDAVNLAARLEALNKQFGTRILVSKRTVDAAGEGVAFQPIGEVSVRGHRAPVSIFTIAFDSPWPSREPVARHLG